MAQDIVEVVMPLMGEGVNEATLVRWLKKPGDVVSKDEPLLEVSTDKVDTEIPAPSSGYLVETFAAEGSTVAVHETLAHIGSEATGSQNKASSSSKAPIEKAGTASTEQSLSLQTAPSSPPATISLKASASDTPQGKGLRSSPLVRKIAKERHVDLQSVKGTGLNGRITKRDILAHLENPSAAAATASMQAHTPARLRTEIVDNVELLDGVPVRREKMSKMRQLIADHMCESVRTSPHVTTVFEVDLQRIVALRARYQKDFLERESFKLTYTPFFVHAAVQAIKRHPIVNVSVDGYDILHKTSINIGCAVAIESGLIVPVIKNAGELSLTGVARRLNDLVVRARSKKLMPDDVRGGTFSITNPGGYGCITSNPIINQPQVAILGIGAVVKRPVVIEGDAIAVRPMMMISLTFDHRVIDGEGGAKFLATLKDILETYEELPL